MKQPFALQRKTQSQPFRLSLSKSASALRQAQGERLSLLVEFTKRAVVPALMLWAGIAQAQFPMIGGMMPGLQQMQAIEMQRHQARTLLYREALDELRKNPQAADIRDCGPSAAAEAGELCIAQPRETPPPPLPSAAATSLSTAAAAPHPAESLEPEPARASLMGSAQGPASGFAQLAGPVLTPAPGPGGASGATLRPASHAVTAAPQSTQASVAPPAAEAPPAPPQARKRIALLIGNNAYPPPIPELETPVNDVQKIGRMLDARFGFQTTVLINGSKADIVRALNAIAAEAGEDDSVLVLYAGHGYLMSENDMGYWIPIDGSVRNPANWISNTDITKFLRAIPARQIMLVSDSCFSGSLTRELKLSSSASMQREEILRRRSVLVLSSGGEEPVSDEGKDGHSIFAWSLLQAFDQVTGLTPGFDVFSNVRKTVTREYPQEPQYGAVVSAGHAPGGEYLLER